MSMTDHAPTTHLQKIRRALAIETHELPRCEREELIESVETLLDRVKAELWADRNGWTVPTYMTSDWHKMRIACHESNTAETGKQ